MNVAWNPKQVPRLRLWVLDDHRDPEPASLVVDLGAPAADVEILTIEIPIPTWWPRRRTSRSSR